MGLFNIMEWYAIFTYDTIYGRHYILSNTYGQKITDIQYNIVIIIPSYLMPKFALTYGHFLQNATVGFERLTNFSNVIDFLSNKIKGIDINTLMDNINDILILDIDDIRGIE